MSNKERDNGSHRGPKTHATTKQQTKSLKQPRASPQAAGHIPHGGPYRL